MGRLRLGLESGLSHGIGSARLGSIQSRPNVLDRTVEGLGRGAHRDTCRRRWPAASCGCVRPQRWLPGCGERSGGSGASRACFSRSWRLLPWLGARWLGVCSRVAVAAARTSPGGASFPGRWAAASTGRGALLLSSRIEERPRGAQFPAAGADVEDPRGDVICRQRGARVSGRGGGVGLRPVSATAGLGPFPLFFFVLSFSAFPLIT